MYARDTESYKISYDKKVCQGPQMSVSDEIYVYRPQYAAFLSKFVMQFVCKEYIKLMWCTIELYKEVETKSHLFFINDNGTLYRVLIARLPSFDKTPEDTKSSD